MLSAALATSASHRIRKSEFACRHASFLVTLALACLLSLHHQAADVGLVPPQVSLQTRPCRGLRTAVVEREDFASGTSSKSTKLVHGGVRYLEKAVFNLDYGQLKLVYEALQERKDLLDNAPHLTSTLPILMPCYKWWEIPFYLSGLKMYDFIAWSKNLAGSKYLFPSESHRRLPTLADTNHAGRSLKGTVRIKT